MELSWRILKECNAPMTILFHCHKTLDRIGGRIDFSPPMRQHPDNGTQEGNFRSQKADFSHFPYIGGGHVVRKDPAQVTFDL